jgi:hypothetical protein
VRLILTEALIKSGSIQDISERLIDYIDRLSDLVQEFDKGRGSNDRSKKTKLPVAFIDAMKKSVKQGIRNNE